MLANIILIVILGVVLCRCFYYRLFIMGLVFFAQKEHNWNIDEREIKRIIDTTFKQWFKKRFNL